MIVPLRLWELDCNWLLWWALFWSCEWWAEESMGVAARGKQAVKRQPAEPHTLPAISNWKPKNEGEWEEDAEGQFIVCSFPGDGVAQRKENTAREAVMLPTRVAATLQQKIWRTGAIERFWASIPWQSAKPVRQATKPFNGVLLPLSELDLPRWPQWALRFARKKWPQRIAANSPPTNSVTFYGTKTTQNAMRLSWEIS